MDQDNDVRNRFTAWMQLVVKRARIDYIRSLKRRKKEISLESEEIADKLIYEPADDNLGCSDGFAFSDEIISVVILNLPPKRRKVLELLFVHNMSPEEIAREMKCTVRHIYNQQSLALKELKEKLKKENK